MLMSVLQELMSVIKTVETTSDLMNALVIWATCSIMMDFIVTVQNESIIPHIQIYDVLFKKIQILMSVLKEMMNAVMCASTQLAVSFVTVQGLAINFKVTP